MQFIQSTSPNYDSRGKYNPEIIVIHCTDGYWPSDKEWLRSSRSKVSTHFIISPEGEVHHLVQVIDRAWHVGVYKGYTAPLKKNAWGRVINPNQYTVGIEVSLKPPEKMGQKQKESLLVVLRYLGEIWGIPLDRKHIWGHKEINAGKTCPGTIDVDDIVRELGFVNKDRIKKQIITLLDKL